MQNNENDPFQPALDQPVDDSILKPSDDEHAQGRFLDGFHAAEPYGSEGMASAEGATKADGARENSDGAADLPSVDEASTAKPANEKDAKKLAKQQAKAVTA